MRQVAEDPPDGDQDARPGQDDDRDQKRAKPIPMAFQHPSSTNAGRHLCRVILQLSVAGLRWGEVGGSSHICSLLLPGEPIFAQLS